jgi:hypothetical protein
MMNLRRVFPLLLLLTLVPSTVQAQGFLRWLGRLSGPGPFWGLGADIALKCLGVDETDEAPGTPEEVRPRVLTGFRFSCPDARLNDRHATVYLVVGGAIAENNPLNYGDAGAQTESTAVRMLKVGASIDWTVHKMVDVGTGAGMVYFAGPRFDNFSLGYVQPVRFTFRPLLISEAAKDHHGWLLLSANWQILLGAIDGADFGAPSDPFRSRNEQDVEVGVSIDVFRFVSWVKHKQKHGSEAR